MTELHRLSASKRKLARSCLWWARPDVELPPSASSKAADLGSALHQGASEEVEGVDGLLVAGDIARLAAEWELTESAAAKLEALQATWSAWWAEFSKTAPGWRTEIPFAYDTATDTARELPKGEQARSYPITSSELPGTIDLHRIAEVVPAGGGKPYLHGWVLDVKTGQPPKYAVDHRDQILQGATVLRRIYGVERVTGGILHVMSDRVKPDTIEFDGWDIDIAAAEMRAELGRIPGAEPCPGTHCKSGYCNARPVCPATREILAQITPTVAPVLRFGAMPVVGPITSKEAARWTYEGLPLLEAWIEERKAAIKVAADALGGIDFPDGRIYAGRDTTNETLRLDVKGAEDAIRSVLGDATDEAISRRVSKDSLFEASRKVAAKGQIGAMRDDAVEAMRAIGAVKVSRYKKYTLRKAGDE